MNNIEKHEKVSEYLILHPNEADRAIAETLEVSPTFVGKTRRYLEAQGKLVKVEIREGKDGRKRRGRGVACLEDRWSYLLKQYHQRYEEKEKYWSDNPRRIKLEAEIAKIEEEINRIGLVWGEAFALGRPTNKVRF